MRHTLIPAPLRKSIHHEYHMRAMIVLVSVAAVGVVAGVAALFPAYIRAWSASHAALGSVASVNSGSNAATLATAQRSLASDDALIAALGGGATAARFTDVIKSIVAVRSQVELSSFALNREGTSTITVTLGGLAPTRDDLLAFKTRLEALSPDAKVDLPIEELAKSTNLAFSLQFTQIMPQ